MGKIKISIGQAILLILQQSSLSSIERSKIESMYLSGCKSPEDAEFLNKIIAREKESNKYLQSCEISVSPEVIDNDPSRRYFETHLAHNITVKEIKAMSLEQVKSHYESLLDLIRSYEPSLATSLTNVMDRRLAPPWDMARIKKIGADVYEYFCTIAEAEKKFGKDDFEKLKYVIASTLLGVVASCISSQKIKENPEDFEILPMDLYGRGLFSSEKRGRTLREGSHFFSTTGIIKSMAPVPYHDDAVRYEDEKKPFDFKSTSNSQYVLGLVSKNWSDQSFSLLFHPFVNTISGTMLCQLRASKKLMEEGKLSFESPNSFLNYVKCLVSSMLYLAGGHSLYEFTYPLTLPEVVEGYASIPHFAEDMTLSRMFYETNTEAFHNALNRAEKYNLQMIERALVLEELRDTHGPERKNT